jgi:pimeloyl-ACP methyl ester carboxylesterase
MVDPSLLRATTDAVSFTDESGRLAESRSIGRTDSSTLTDMAHTIRPVLLLAMSLAGVAYAASDPPATVWTVAAVDPKGDGREPSAIDVAQLSYRYDRTDDLLWFRVAVYGTVNLDAFNIAFALDSGSGDARRTQWSGAGTDFMFDRLATARIARTTGGYQATVDGCGPDDSSASTSVRRSPAAVRVAADSIAIGLQRSCLIGPSMKMRLVVSIGSNDRWHDDIPNGGSVTIDLTAPRPTRGIREIDVGRNNLRFASGQRMLSDAAPPRISKNGSGGRALILIPGVYSGGAVFDTFIARNRSVYTFHVITPPGLSGTAARPLPPESASIGDYPWTRRLKRDILDLIVRQRLDKPILVAHGFPGTLAAEALAVSHSHLLGGVVEIAAMPPVSLPTATNSRRELTPAERVATVDASWLPLWFKYVTPETWESNNYPAEMFASDPVRGERARRQVESVPLPIKIHYLVENMAWDRRDDLARLEVPVLALIPGFDEQLLANPQFAWFKTSFQDGWAPLRHNPRLEFTTVPNAGVLMLDDQPAITDMAVANFVDRHARRVFEH